nr:RHS repeat domain-containing protein [Streptomyces sp. MK5]
MPFSTPCVIPSARQRSNTSCTLRAFAYDETGDDLTSIRNAVDSPLHLTYDHAHRIASRRDSNDTTFAYEYDAQRRVTATRGIDDTLNSRIVYADPDESGATAATAPTPSGTPPSIAPTGTVRSSPSSTLSTPRLASPGTRRIARSSARVGSDGAHESWSWDGENDCLSHTDPADGRSEFTYGPFDLLRTRTPTVVTFTF